MCPLLAILISAIRSFFRAPEVRVEAELANQLLLGPLLYLLFIFVCPTFVNLNTVIPHVFMSRPPAAIVTLTYPLSNLATTPLS